VVESPSTHDEILCIGMGRLFLLDAAADIPNKLEVERLSEAAGDLALRLREILAVGSNRSAQTCAPLPASIS